MINSLNFTLSISYKIKLLIIRYSYSSHVIEK